METRTISLINKNSNVKDRKIESLLHVQVKCDLLSTVQS